MLLQAHRGHHFPWSLCPFPSARPVSQPQPCRKAKQGLQLRQEEGKGHRCLSAVDQHPSSSADPQLHAWWSLWLGFYNQNNISPPSMYARAAVQAPQLFIADECKVFIQLITTTPPPRWALFCVGDWRDMRLVPSLSPRPRSVSLVCAGPIGLWHCVTLQLTSCTAVMSPSHIPLCSMRTNSFRYARAACVTAEIYCAMQNKSMYVWPESESDSRRWILGLRKGEERNYRGRLHTRAWK